MFLDKIISSKIKAFQSKLDSLDAELDEKSKRLTILNNNILALEKKQKEYVDDGAEYSKEIKELLARRDREKERNNIIKEKYNENLKKVNALKNEADELQKIKSNKEREIVDLTEQYNSRKKDIALLNEEITDLEYKKKILKKELENVDFDSLDFIDKIEEGYDFEKYVASLLSKLGYKNIEVTSKSCDYGVDVVAENSDDVKWGFQCKLYSNPVGVDAVQQALSGKTHYHCAIVAVVTNSFFTKEAKKITQENSVQLWDREKLAKKLNDLKRRV